MTPPTTWHPGDDQLQTYVDGGLPGLSAASIEAHLLACRTCRSAVSGAVEPARLDTVKSRLEDRLDRIERPRLERLLLRLRVDEADARALLAAPNIRRAWVVALVGAALLGAAVAESAARADDLFLLLAPLVPLAATAIAYAPSLDPAFALVSATPYSMARLLLARSLAVGVTAVVGVGAASLLLPGAHATEVVWFLPAVALTGLVLALAPRFGIGPAAWCVGLAWTGLVSGLEHRGTETEWVAGAGTQAVAALVTAAVVLVLVRQWRELELRGMQA